MPPPSPPVIAGLSQIIDHYDGFILDLWGCIHNGVEPFPGVLDALKRARGAGKRLLVLSNAPRRATSVATSMAKLGVDPALVDDILSSGEATWQALVDRSDPWHAALGRRALHIGPARDIGLFEGSGVERTTDVAVADFVLATGPTDDSLDLAAHEGLLQASRSRGLKLLCANPDLDVIRGTTRLICSGALAARYIEMGGEAREHGKPHAAIYKRALSMIGVADRKRVVAVGDSFRTDVAGARGADLDVVFIPGGIHAEGMGFRHGDVPSAAAIAALAAEYKVSPTWVLPDLRW
jgi:HAD superfamily hydrolase (TIGR01459 family)